MPAKLANHPIYSIAKGGNISMTKSLAMELAPEVRVNGVAPGAILWPEHEEDDLENINQCLRKFQWVDWAPKWI